MDDETRFLGSMDNLDSDSDPTARSIVQCLQMLADEAAALGLCRTLDALHAAMQVCARESDLGDPAECEVCAPAGTLLH